jgi:shikimate 5-dehydrogenase
MARNISTTRGIVRGVRALRSHPEVEVLWSGIQKNSSPRIRQKHEKILEYPEQIHEYDFIIQTTPMGMGGHTDSEKTPLLEEFLRDDQTLFDIVYTPDETPLVKLAKKKKIDIIPGYKMLLHQGVRQFELFTGTSAPIEAMEKALKAELLKT